MHYVNNYGSVLQSFATQWYFKKLGFDSEIIDYTRPNCDYKYIKNRINNGYKNKRGVFGSAPIVFVRTVIWSADYKIRNRKFDSFRNKYLKLSKKYEREELFSNPPIADLYCTGSDQTWNTEYNDGILDEYFLSFAPKGKGRFSFSASFGCDSINENISHTIKQYLKEYDLITVRELSGERIIKDLGIDKCHQIVDPTLLLDAQEWKSIFNIRNSNRQYILLYLLNKHDHLIDEVERFANTKKVSVVLISNVKYKIPLSWKNYRNPSVEQFLFLFANASYILTDSFHGTSFGINFGKKIRVVRPPQYSTRLESILEILGLKSALYDCEQNILFNDINYDCVNMRLKSERAKVNTIFMGYLKNDNNQL